MINTTIPSERYHKQKVDIQEKYIDGQFPKLKSLKGQSRYISVGRQVAVDSIYGRYKMVSRGMVVVVG